LGDLSCEILNEERIIKGINPVVSNTSKRLMPSIPKLKVIPREGIHGA
jgi:hypothetical protein